MNFTEPLVHNPQRRNDLLRVLQYTFFGGVILYFGRTVLIPLAYATLISFVLYPFCAWLERKGFGRILSIGIGVGALTILLLLIVFVLVKQVSDLGDEWSRLQPRIEAASSSLRQFLADSLGISIQRQDEWLAKLPEQVFGSALALIKGTISISASTMVKAILIPVYVVLILYYRRLWKLVLCKIFSSESHESISMMISMTIDTYYNFIKGMAIVYLIVGILNSLGLLALGVPHAFLFGIVASVLTFIPYIGIMVGALLPVAVSWIIHDSIWYPLGVIAVFTFVQYLEANVIFPFAVSSRLKVNTMAVLLAIFIGGMLWGVSGMILFVPFVGIIKLIADSNPQWQTISLALGTGLTDGKEKNMLV